MCTQVWKSTSFSDITLVLYFVSWDVASLTCIVRCSQMYCCRFTLDKSVCGFITFTLERETQHRFTLTPLPVHWCVSSIIACLLHVAYVYYRHMERMTSCKWRESLLESLWGNDGGVAQPSPPCCLQCYAQGWQLLQLNFWKKGSFAEHVQWWQGKNLYCEQQKAWQWKKARKKHAQKMLAMEHLQYLCKKLAPQNRRRVLTQRGHILGNIQYLLFFIPTLQLTFLIMQLICEV